MKRCELKVQPRNHICTFKSVKECEGMNPHTPKWTPNWGVRVLMESWIFKEGFQGSELIRLKSYLYHFKALETKMFKMGLYNPFEYL